MLEHNENLGSSVGLVRIKLYLIKPITEDSCQEREEQLAQAQQDADEMADMVRQNEHRIAAYTEQLKEKDDRIRPWSRSYEP